MKCFVCDKDISNAEISSVVPLMHESDTVYACVGHNGVKEEFERQSREEAKENTEN